MPYFWFSLKKERLSFKYSVLKITIFRSVAFLVMRSGSWLHIYDVIRQNWTLSIFQTQKCLKYRHLPIFFPTLQCAIFSCKLFNFCLNSPVVCHHKEPHHSKAGKVTWKSVCAATVIKYQYLVLAYWFYLTETDSYCHTVLIVFLCIHYSHCVLLKTHLSLSITDTLFNGTKAFRPSFFSVWK